MPERQPITIYVTPDERQCIDAAAANHQLSRSAFVRKVALYRAGWCGYSGPMFSSFRDAAELQRWQLADLLYEAARTLEEGARTLLALYDKGEQPTDTLLSTVAAFARVITRGKGHLVYERLGTDPGLARRLEMQGRVLTELHALVGKQVAAAAAEVRSAMEIDHGKQQEPKKKRGRSPKGK